MAAQFLQDQACYTPIKRGCEQPNRKTVLCVWGSSGSGVPIDWFLNLLIFLGYISTS